MYIETGVSKRKLNKILFHLPLFSEIFSPLISYVLIKIPLAFFWRLERVSRRFATKFVPRMLAVMSRVYVWVLYAPVTK